MIGRVGKRGHRTARPRLLQGQSGMTLLELMVTTVMILILASVAMPLSRVGERRTKEIELRQHLRDLRNALDRFKADWDEKKISRTESDIANEETGYPRRLDVLVTGAPSGDLNEKKVRKYLRRIPVDPFTGASKWGTRCYQDEPDSLISCEQDVYDVFSLSGGTGLDGTKYQTW